ncbi:hypothetical protein [Bacillus mojavensis]
MNQIKSTINEVRKVDFYGWSMFLILIGAASLMIIGVAHLGS